MKKYKFLWTDDDKRILADTITGPLPSLTEALRHAMEASLREDGEGATQCAITVVQDE